MNKITEEQRLYLTELYRKQIFRFGIERWKKHSKSIVKAAHKRLKTNKKV